MLDITFETVVLEPVTTLNCRRRLLANQSGNLHRKTQRCSPVLRGEYTVWYLSSLTKLCFTKHASMG